MHISEVGVKRRAFFAVNSTVVISLMLVFIVVLLFVGAPIRPVRFVGQTMAKLGIGLLFLFFFNVFGGSIGLNIPINLFTTAISGFLGIFGVAALAVIQIFV